MTDAVPVTRADRELYLTLGIFHTCADDAILEWGWADDSTEMQAIARHRGSTAVVDVEKKLREGLEAARLSSPGFRIKVLSDTIARALASLSPMEPDSFQKPYADAGHDVASVFAHPKYECSRCGAAQIDLSEDLSYGNMRPCRPPATPMDDAGENSRDVR